MSEEPRDERAPMTFEDFRHSFYYGTHADMQFKFLKNLNDEDAADGLALLLHRLGEAFDTGDWDAVRRTAFELQVAAYRPPDPVEPEFDDAPFTPLTEPVAEVPLALISAGGIFRRDDDPRGPDAPTQDEVLDEIKDHLRSVPELLELPADTAPDELGARHPGYDAETAQRDPNTAFPLEILRGLEGEGRLTLAPVHYSFIGAASQVRLRERVAPEWAQRLLEARVGAALLVAT